jgi:hypothetical protein
MTDAAEVGASVEAIVGTVANFKPKSFATAFAVSIAFPPPTPIITFEDHFQQFSKQVYLLEVTHCYLVYQYMYQLSL